MKTALTSGEESSLREMAEELANSTRGWTLAVRREAGLVASEHLMKGDEGVVLMTLPTRLTSGQRGWIGSGPNRFEVREIREFTEWPGISCCIGKVVAGSFHVSNPGLQVHRDGPTAT